MVTAKLSPPRINMKTARFLFTMVGFGALALRLGFARETSDQAREPALSENRAKTTNDRSADQALGYPARGNRDQADEKHSKSNDDRHIFEKSSQADPIMKAIPMHRHDQARPKQVTNSHEDSCDKRVLNPRTKSTSVNDLHQRALNQPSTAAKGGLMMNRTGNPREQLVKLPVGSRTTALLPGVVLGRGATTGIIGGLALSSAKNSTAVINGTGMRRKP
jgi:hypothetical protein